MQPAMAPANADSDPWADVFRVEPNDLQPVEQEVDCVEFDEDDEDHVMYLRQLVHSQLYTNQEISVALNVCQFYLPLRTLVHAWLTSFPSLSSQCTKSSTCSLALEFAAPPTTPLRSLYHLSMLCVRVRPGPLVGRT